MRALTPLLFLLLITSVVNGQSAQSLKDALLNHTIVVRGYYTGSVLQFDTDGKLVSPATPGFGVDDGSIYVTDLRLSPDKLIVEGQRTFQAYDEKSKQFQLALAPDKVKLEISLPPDKPASAAVPELLKKVLLTDAEIQNNCSAEERARFQVENEPIKRREHAPGTQGAASLEAICFPTGEKAYRVGGSVKPPKVIKTPEPDYADAVKQAHTQGTVRVLMIVNQEGRPTTLYLLQSAGQHLDSEAVKAIQKWQFQPSLFQGTPIPVAVNVEMNFHLP
jgi:TonB family protein